MQCNQSSYKYFTVSWLNSGFLRNATELTRRIVWVTVHVFSRKLVFPEILQKLGIIFTPSYFSPSVCQIFAWEFRVYTITTKTTGNIRSWADAGWSCADAIQPERRVTWYEMGRRDLSNDDNVTCSCRRQRTTSSIILDYSLDYLRGALTH